MANETDSLLDDVRAAATELAGAADPPAAATTAEAPATTDTTEAPGRARDEHGRFAPKATDDERPTLTLKEKPPVDPAAVPAPNGEDKTAAPPTAADQTKAPEIPAPVEWRGAAKTKWARLPREVQAEIAERHTAAEQRAAQYAPLEQAIAPYREAWTRDAGSVEQAIGQLGQFYRLYLDNPVGLIQHIAATRGINLGAPQGQQPPQGEAPQPPPDIASIVKHAVQQEIGPIQQRFVQTENQALNDTISAFAADPKHPFFQDVKVHMGQLLQAGAAKDLNEAYDQATWANPTIRAHLMAQQQDETKKQQAADVAKANAARAASLRGSPLPGGASGSGGQNSNSVLEDVRAAAAENAGA